MKCSEDKIKTKTLRKFPTTMHYITLSPEDLVYIINVYNNPSKLFLMLPNNYPLTVGADLELEQQLRHDFKTESDKTFLKNKSNSGVINYWQTLYSGAVTNMNPDVQEKWQKARQLVRSFSTVATYFSRQYFIKAKNSSGGGVDAANIMLAQLNAQKPIKKKTSQEMPSSSPGTQ